MLRTIFAVLAALLAFTSPGHAKEAVFTLHPQEAWGNVFGGKEAIFHVSVVSRESARGTVSWRFASEGHTIARGEQAVDVTPSRPTVVEIKLAVPAVKEGVVIPASLALALTKSGADKAVVETTKPIWIFPEDPFAGKIEWLKKLNIKLFDPAGKTAALFTKIDIPFKETRNVDALAEFKDSVLIVGEGVSLKEYRGLADMMVKAAVAGIPVLCLAPADGALPMPGVATEDQPMPSSVRLDGTRVITRLDKRIDAEAWPPDGRIAQKGFTLQAERAGIVASVSEGATGWSWIEARYPNPRGRLLVCMFGIVARWDAGPAPRYCLAELLDYATKPGDE